ncbi:MAG: glycerol-3-phosphate 1-O-acyltransferase [Acidimicrobiia bacterium]|nr:glycerol-3-phosphate 1-O-acyltransferase [Acidimicrobiia bacterium]
MVLPDTELPLLEEPAWPVDEPSPVVFLIDASSNLERRLMEAWIDRNRPPDATVDAVCLPASRRRRQGCRIDPGLEARMAKSEDPVLVPLRIAWLAPRRDGTRSVRLADLLKLGDPRDPDLLRQYLILARAPDRCQILVGEPASSSELTARWQEGVESSSLSDFVARRAWLALERAERRVRGNRYKVPKFVHQEILSTSEFGEGIVRFADQLDKPEETIFNRATRYLREIAASHDAFTIDLVANAIHWLYRQGYGSIHYDNADFGEIYSLGQQNSLVFLPSHKSNLDHLVLQYLLWENDAPPNHTAGGINLNFFPIGPIIRRTGVFFIRRTFKDNPVYKFVLRSYIDYLIANRFPLEWYLEGGRSRSGKLLPPRYGMLTYVADSFRRGKAEDVFVVPTSISYDQIQDVGSYAAEQLGRAKEKESFSWFVRSVRSLRMRYGNIHVRFGEPISLAKEMQGGESEQGLAVRKLAFETLARINRVTPITPTSLVTIALLANEDRALRCEDVVGGVRDLVSYVERRNLPLTEPIRLDSPKGVQLVLDRLVEHGIVTEYAAGPETLYMIGSDQHLAAAYYRNTIIHFFVNDAITELALLAAAEAEDGNRPAVFWDQVMAMRDLLKFEFFFSEKEAFREEIFQEISHHDPEWETRLDGQPDEAREILRGFRLLTAPWVLRPFLEAYQVVADSLNAHSPYVEVDQRRFIAGCLGLGKQYRLQRKIATEESISQILFKSALALADNRDLLDIDDENLAARRKAFAKEIQETLRRIDAIDALKAVRRAGI